MRSPNGIVAEELAQLSIRNITHLSRVGWAMLALRIDHRPEEYPRVPSTHLPSMLRTQRGTNLPAQIDRHTLDD